MTSSWICAAAWLLAAGCNLIDSKALGESYALDPIEFRQGFADEKTPQTIPTAACDAAQMPDACQAAAAMLGVPPGSSETLACDPGSKSCVATAELRLLTTINLAKQSSFPPDAVKYGVSAVSISKVSYWIVTNTLDFTVPAVDLFVAPQTALDENDKQATRIGSVARVQAGSAMCGDAKDKDPQAGMAVVCDLPLSDAGQAALATFAKNYQTPFQLIAHARVTAKAGEPLPAGTIDLVVHPTIFIGIHP